MAAVLISKNISEHEGHKLVKEFRVDYHKSDQHVRVNIDITMFNAPCSIVSIDYRDLMGQDVHEIPVSKIPIGKNKRESKVSIRYILEGLTRGRKSL